MWVFNIKNFSPIFSLFFVRFWYFFNRLSGKLGKYTEFFRQAYDFVLVGNILMPIPLGE